MLYLFCTTSLVKLILWPVACYYIHMHVHGICWSYKELCDALGLQHFPLVEWCSVSPLAGASETYFFKHWWWWCQWHRADYKGPLGRTLLPKHSRALPALSLSRAEAYLKATGPYCSVLSHFLWTQKHRINNFSSKTWTSFFRLFQFSLPPAFGWVFILLL